MRKKKRQKKDPFEIKKKMDREIQYFNCVLELKKRGEMVLLEFLGPNDQVRVRRPHDSWEDFVADALRNGEAEVYLPEPDEPGKITTVKVRTVTDKEPMN